SNVPSLAGYSGRHGGSRPRPLSPRGAPCQNGRPCQSRVAECPFGRFPPDPESVMPTTAYIALGSNLGDRRRFLDQALQLLRDTPRVPVGRVSAYHETEPVGGPPGQGAYLNAAAELETDLPPNELLHLLLDVEARLGRVRQERFGPRTIDLDLSMYGEATSD